MTETVRSVSIGEMVVSKNPNDLLVAYGLGSCVAVCAYDPRARIGGMLHALLPASPNGAASETNPAKFVREGVPVLLKELAKQGANQSRLVVRLCGGAQMLVAAQLNNTSLNIGSRNVTAATETLKNSGLRIKDQITGGHAGRTVKMNISTGKIVVRTLGHGEQVLD